jgi:hypothetical protein
MRKLLRPMSFILILLGAASLVLAADKMVFTAQLNGASEVPPFDTQARGQFIISSKNGELEYKLIVANLSGILAAHLHCAPAGSNGPVGVTLYSGSPVTISGILASGPILAPDTGNVCGWTNVNDILAGIVSGNTYINVHTQNHLPGEVRGQVH